MDVAEHFAAIWARRLTILAVAVLSALVVIAWRSAQEATYAATATVQMSVAGSEFSDPAIEADFYAQTAVALAGSRELVSRAVTASGQQADVDTVLSGLEVEQGSEPGFVSVTADGASPTQAAELSNAVVAALADRMAAEHSESVKTTTRATTEALTDVRRRLDRLSPDAPARAGLVRQRESLLDELATARSQATPRLSVVESAVTPESPDSPRPLREGLLAFFVVAILTAELLVARRAWRGALSERDPARDVAAALGTPAVRVDSGGAGRLSTSALLPQLSGHRTVTVIQRGRGPQTSVAATLAELSIADGGSVLLVEIDHREQAHPADVTAACSTPGSGEISAVSETDGGAVQTRGERLSVLHYRLGGQTTDDFFDSRALADLVAAASQPRVVVLVSADNVETQLGVATTLGEAVLLEIEAHSVTRPELLTWAEALRGVGADIAGAVVHRSGLPWRHRFDRLFRGRRSLGQQRTEITPT